MFSILLDCLPLKEDTVILVCNEHIQFPIHTLEQRMYIEIILFKLIILTIILLIIQFKANLKSPLRFGAKKMVRGRIFRVFCRKFPELYNCRSYIFSVQRINSYARKSVFPH